MISHSVINRTVSIVLFILIAAQMISCGSTDNPERNSSEVTATVLTEEPTTVKIILPIEAEDFEGRSVTILASKAIGQNFPFYEVYAEDISGETVNDAVYERNGKIEEKYNITIKALDEHPGNLRFLQRLQEEAFSGSRDFDIVLPNSVDAFNAALLHLGEFSKLIQSVSFLGSEKT